MAAVYDTFTSVMTWLRHTIYIYQRKVYQRKDMAAAYERNDMASSIYQRKDTHLPTQTHGCSIQCTNFTSAML